MLGKIAEINDLNESGSFADYGGDFDMGNQTKSDKHKDDFLTVMSSKNTSYKAAYKSNQGDQRSKDSMAGKMMSSYHTLNWTKDDGLNDDIVNPTALTDEGKDRNGTASVSLARQLASLNDNRQNLT